MSKPAYRKPIRSQRCLVVVSAFIEGPKKEGLSKPYLVHLREHRRPFALAGIFDYWKNPETGQILKSYSIITTTANQLLQKIGHHRMPVILNPGEEKAWISNDLGLHDVSRFLRPFDHEQMNAYPLDPAIKSPKATGRELLEPKGPNIYPDYEIKVTQEVRTLGMGNSKRERSE